MSGGYATCVEDDDGPVETPYFERFALYQKPDPTPVTAVVIIRQPPPPWSNVLLTLVSATLAGALLVYCLFSDDMRFRRRPRRDENYVWIGDG